MSNWQSKFEFSSGVSTSPVNEIKGISTQEIKSLKNRIVFYIEHYSIIVKKLPTKDTTSKIDKLKAVLILIENEIIRRANSLNI
ncbi:MAG: hypothetical protein WCK67_05410 [bacterium]